MMKSVSADLRVLSLVSWLLSLFYFGLRWSVFWVIGLVRIIWVFLSTIFTKQYNDSSEFQQLMDQRLRKIYSEAASSLSSEELMKLQDEAMQKRRTVHYPPRENE